MATSILDKKEIFPEESNLENFLLGNYTTWKSFISYLEKEYGTINTEWKFYSKNSGWCLKVSDTNRNLVFLLPNDNYFIININMSLKVAKKVLNSNISIVIKKLIDEAKPYVEGISILVKINSEKDLEDVKEILEIRDNNE